MILKDLQDLELGFVKQKSNVFHVYIGDQKRSEVLNLIAEKLNGFYDKTPTSTSSAGKVVLGKNKIYVKPSNKQGNNSYGKSNEKFFLEMLLSFSKKIKWIYFMSNNITKVISYTSHEDVSSNKKRNKADVKINGLNTAVYISIKKENAQIWESADTYAKNIIKNYVDKLQQDKKIKLSFENNVYKIYPNVAIECTDKESEDVVFGEDILTHGFICIRNFKKEDFHLQDNVLFVKCDQIVCSLSDLYPYQKPFFLIRNDSTRNCYYKGLRVLACYASRINSNVMTIKLNQRFDFPVIT